MFPPVDHGDDTSVDHVVIPPVDQGDDPPADHDVIPPVDQGDDNPADHDVLPPVDQGDDPPAGHDVLPPVNYDDHPYDVKPKTREELEAEILRLKKVNNDLMIKKDNLESKVRYYKRKAGNLQELVNNQKQLICKLKEQFGITGDVGEMLSQTSNRLPADFFKSFCKRICGSQEHEYSPEVRKFALTLQLCSLKAYR